MFAYVDLFCVQALSAVPIRFGHEMNEQNSEAKSGGHKLEHKH